MQNWKSKSSRSKNICYKNFAIAEFRTRALGVSGMHTDTYAILPPGKYDIFL